MSETCLLPNCPVGSLREDIKEIKENQKIILDIISENKMILSEIKNLREDYRTLKTDNDREHDILFSKVNSKLDKTDAKWAIGIGLTISAVVFTVINIILKLVMK